MQYSIGPILAKINTPDDLKKLSIEELSLLCQDLRQYIIDVVSENGGHFGAGLGVIELTTALHFVLNTPYDKLIWDVGHQAYAHKILTGRKDLFPSNRKQNGLSGFPSRTESEYDAFGVGHSSTSISAALGMAVASKLKNEKQRRIVAVIGDGALTAGIAFEAINHASVAKADITIILNDNNISIDPVVGGLKTYLSNMTNPPANPNLDIALAHKEITNNSASSTFSHQIQNYAAQSSNLFEALGLQYFGIVDGHNVAQLIHTLQEIVDLPGPKLLHVKTIKGKGFEAAEKQQTLWHAPGLFDKLSGKINQKKNPEAEPPKFQDVFGHTILELAQLNPKIMGITPAMPSGSSLKFMIEAMPDRAIDVGIAEQHAVTFSAGLATQGMKVFCNIYSTFSQRAYDMIIHDVALQNLPVIFCLDRAGLVGEDGATHQGVFDIAFLRCIPNMIIAAPMNEEELRDMMFTAQLDSFQQPIAIRYPRGKGVMLNWQTPFKAMPIGKAQLIQSGENIAILSFGPLGNVVQEVCKNLATKNCIPAHYNMRFVKPLDEDALHEVAKKYKYIITIEDGSKIGGLGDAVLAFLNENNYQNEVHILGVPDQFIFHATPEEQYKTCGLDAASITQLILSLHTSQK